MAVITLFFDGFASLVSAAGNAVANRVAQSTGVMIFFSFITIELTFIILLFYSFRLIIIIMWRART